MTQPTESLSNETHPGAAAAYDALVSTQAVQAFGERIAEEAKRFDYDQEMTGIRAAEEALSGQTAELARDDSVDETARMERIGDITRQSHELADRRKVAGQLQSFMHNRQYHWENHGQMLFTRHEEEVGQLAGELAAAATEHNGFVQPDDFRRMIDKTARTIEIDASDDPLEFPLGAIVSAEGFESWDGRGRSLKDDRPSREVIEDYAARDTEIPPVDQATAVIMPDGGVVLMSHNAHRVAAARLKGQATMQVRDLTVVKAREDAVLPAVPVGETSA